MKNIGLVACCSFALLLAVNRTAEANPPFSGTVYLDPDIITPADPAAFQGGTLVARDRSGRTCTPPNLEPAECCA